MSYSHDRRTDGRDCVVLLLLSWTNLTIVVSVSSSVGSKTVAVAETGVSVSETGVSKTGVSTSIPTISKTSNTGWVKTTIASISSWVEAFSGGSSQYGGEDKL